ncbi:hypothetical protein CORC01_02680 [Colletotrichum orchidophilum]|uniref:Uncharacterized protein n=1 Tax=Colletotrichum orchidophilum TaxID=1209926 RepID=A0A1G4BKY4_9PEZI|nr:uncharacterized protein CORC01_02680 [Colletotrichum orchidophilum]OHF02101.1 hypothetical protein CORC01_02680 [Colletotrichum orchidophilum]
MALTPRMNPYLRLLFRLYEALVLLSIIRPVGGPHVVSQLGNYTLQDIRRRFFKNLAFLCDYKKGGSSTTAIGVEDSIDCYIFWVASNEGAGDRVVHFLKETLEKLQKFVERVDDRAAAEDGLVAWCTAFASERIKQEARILRNSATKCQNSPKGSDEEAGALCRAAYRSRNDDEMRRIEQLGQESEDVLHPAPVTAAYRAVRHMVGRLAARIRSVNQLLDDASRMETFLETYQVRAVERPISAEVPAADAHTTLPRILNRIIPDTDAQYESHLGFLQRVDSQVQIESKLQAKFQVGGLQTCVHAEIQMLHHFWDSGCRYVSNDRYIACSKPACIGCESYVRHHPARATLLDNHQNVYANWGVVSLLGGTGNDGWKNQRKIINNVIGDLKAMVVEQLEELQTTTIKHPDSLTGITASLVDIGDDSGSDTEEADGSQAGPSSEVFGLDSAIGLLNLQHDTIGGHPQESEDDRQLENDDKVNGDDEAENDEGGGVQI